MVKNIYTAAMSLLLMVVLASWSTEAGAQGTAQGKHKHRRGQKAHHKATSSARTKNKIGVSVTLSRTSRESPYVSDKTKSNLDMTSGFMTEVFRKQKGHLPWPVDSKNIATSFGYQRYEPNPSVYRNNLGINIAIDKDSCVRVVYDGVVDDVMDIGDAKAIIVAHGKYFSIYSDLSMSIVVKGQVVSAGDVLGQVGETGQVDFRIFDPNDVWQDPAKWLVRGK